jgi:hypothetical protein
MRDRREDSATGAKTARRRPACHGAACGARRVHTRHIMWDDAGSRCCLVVVAQLHIVTCCAGGVAWLLVEAPGVGGGGCGGGGCGGGGSRPCDDDGARAPLQPARKSNIRGYRPKCFEVFPRCVNIRLAASSLGAEQRDAFGNHLTIWRGARKTGEERGERMAMDDGCGLGTLHVVRACVCRCRAQVPEPASRQGARG